MIKPLLCCLVGTLIGCAAVKKPASRSAEAYTEDLSFLRERLEAPVSPGVEGEVKEGNTPEFYSAITPVYDVTVELNTVLDSIDRLKKDKHFLEGFTIQVYSGGSREKAYLTRGKLYALMPETDPVLRYDEVNFTVKIGKFYSKLEAQKLYSQIKKKFPNAAIIPENIYIR